MTTSFGSSTRATAALIFRLRRRLTRGKPRVRPPHAARWSAPARSSSWDVRNERRFLTDGTVAVQRAVGADDRFGAAVTNYEEMVPGPAGLGGPVREIWRDFFHVTDSDER